MSDSFISWEEAVCRLRSDPEQQQLVRHCYYDDPIEKAAERFALSEEWQAIARLLDGKIPSAVLDIGAGRGIASYAFASHGCSVTALEPDPSPIVGSQAIRELSARSGLPISIVENWGESLPFPDNAFNVVYGRAVLHHARDIEKFCVEVHRVLRPGGVFLMTREHVISHKADLQKFLKSHPLHHLYGGEMAYPLADYVLAIKNSGLQSLQVIGPFESVINYAPMSEKEFRQRIGQIFMPPLLGWIAEGLAGWRIFNEWAGRKLSAKSDAPGRHYTFLAVK